MEVHTYVFFLPCHCVFRFSLVIVVLEKHSFHLFLQDFELPHCYSEWAMPHTKQWSEWKTLKEAIPSMPPIVYTDVKLRSSRYSFGTRMLSSIKCCQIAFQRNIHDNGQVHTTKKFMPCLIELISRVAGERVIDDTGRKLSFFPLQTCPIRYYRTTMSD